MAGEFGHIPIDANGPVCGCGARGCWGVFASSNAALRYYAESKPKVMARTIEELLRLSGEEDPKAVAALTKQAEYVGHGLRLISAALAPEVILIAGDIVASWGRLAPIIEKAFAESILAGLKPRLMPTHEPDVARLRGADLVRPLRHRGAGQLVGDGTGRPDQLIGDGQPRHGARGRRTAGRRSCVG